MNERKEKVKLALKELFNKYKDEGIISIYLYGSITGQDFNADSSDIDTIVVAEQKLSLDMEDEMKEFLSKRFSEIPRFGVRILYLDELNLMESSQKSKLTFFIPAKILLSDFPYWELVSGKKFTTSDFPEISSQDLIKSTYNVLTQWDWEKIDNVSDEKVENYMKVIARILWSVDLHQGKKYKFSYSSISDRDDKYKAIADLISESKKKGWEAIFFLDNKDIFQSFVDDIKNTYT